MTEHDAAAAAPTDEELAADPYDTGHDWRCDDFAAKWSVDTDELRRGLNVCSFMMRIDFGETSAGQAKRELTQIAEAAEELARAIRNANKDTIWRLLQVRARGEERNNLRLRPEFYRQRLASEIKQYASDAKLMAGHLKITKKRNLGKPTSIERTVVGAFARLWHQSHGEWPTVTDRKTGNKPGRAASAAGCFVMAAAKEFFGIQLSDQRLRTVFGSLQRPPAVT
jgi:hypothetical protein